MLSTSTIPARYRYNESLVYNEVYGYPGRQWMYDRNLLDIPTGPSVPGLGDHQIPVVAPGISFNASMWQQEHRYTSIARQLDERVHAQPSLLSAYHTYKQFLAQRWDPLFAAWVQAYANNPDMPPEAVASFARQLKEDVWPAAKMIGVPDLTRVQGVGLGQVFDDDELPAARRAMEQPRYRRQADEPQKRFDYTPMILGFGLLATTSAVWLLSLSKKPLPQPSLRRRVRR